METYVAVVLFTLFAMVVTWSLPLWIFRWANPSPFKDPETLRREAARLRAKLNSRQDSPLTESRLD